ncbi:MAG TPA: glycosyltransferase family 2 protein [Candidatus Hydrogenedentes bacterium]|nr:glycosyltransferase family 2 protein [Candidatus Hydrogenedentota bacterium]HPC17490.1 glycosyltransferase family 2 protein [Candidatus Hydrogenedentota bacterium]HRT21426.1 glycosyltransferase family 2 protein [Candidatus Hydrogenedentota bacterium]HRT66314.1 glycosyltransferase family 2 protein [Candidatus Hydrogenedentota bacterium]
MKADNVSIVIPAFNEAGAIGPVVESLRVRLPEAELIVVNDGSSDDTASIAEAAGATVVSHPKNRGYGAALRTGTLQASRAYVLFCDSDGQHSTDDVARLIEACDGHDMVVGARGQDSHAPLARRPGKRILTLFADYLAGEKIPDLNSGLRMIRREVLLKYLHLMPSGFSFSTTSTFAMLKTNRHILWIPITVAARVGQSTVRQWKHGPQTLLLLLRLTVLFEPLKVFLVASGILACFTLASFAIDVMASGRINLGDSTVLLGVASLLVFLFGLLCDQVSALRRELHE